MPSVPPQLSRCTVKKKRGQSKEEEEGVSGSSATRVGLSFVSFTFILLRSEQKRQSSGAKKGKEGEQLGEKEDEKQSEEER